MYNNSSKVGESFINDSLINSHKETSQKNKSFNPSNRITSTTLSSGISNSPNSKGNLKFNQNNKDDFKFTTNSIDEIGPNIQDSLPNNSNNVDFMKTGFGITDIGKTSTAVIELDEDSSNYHQWLTSLNIHWKKYLLEKSLWTAEKLELNAKIATLEGQLRSYASVNIELVERIKILESALLTSRGMHPNDSHSVAPSNYQPDLCITDLLSKKKIQRGVNILQNYLNEIKVVDQCINEMNPTPLMVDREFPFFSNQFKSNSPTNFKKSELSQNDLPYENRNQESDNDFSEIGYQNVLNDDLNTNACKQKFNNGSECVNSKDFNNFFDKNQFNSKLYDKSVKIARNNFKSKMMEDNDISPFNDSTLPVNNKVKILKNDNLNLDKKINYNNDFDFEVIGDLENIFEISDISSISDCKSSSIRTRSKTITGEKSYTWVTTNSFWGHTEIIRDVDFHPFSKIIASSSDDGLICIWEFDDASNLEISPSSFLRGHSSPVICCLFNHMGDLLYSSDLDGNINVWNLSNEKILQSYKFSDEAVWSLSYNSVSNTLLSLSADGICCFWKPTISEPFLKFQPFTGTDVRYIGAYFNNFNDNQIICVSSDTILVYDFIKKCSIISIKPFNDYDPDNDLNQINCATINPKQMLIAIGCENNYVYVYNLENGDNIKMFIPHNKPVSAIAYDPNGETLSTGDTSGSINIWDNNFTCIQSMNSAHRPKVNDGVLVISFHKTLKFMASGGSDDFVKLYI